MTQDAANAKYQSDLAAWRAPTATGTGVAGNDIGNIVSAATTDSATGHLGVPTTTVGYGGSGGPAIPAVGVLPTAPTRTTLAKTMTSSSNNNNELLQQCRQYRHQRHQPCRRARLLHQYGQSTLMAAATAFPWKLYGGAARPDAISGLAPSSQQALQSVLRCGTSGGAARIGSELGLSQPRTAEGTVGRLRQKWPNRGSPGQVAPQHR